MYKIIPHYCKSDIKYSIYVWKTYNQINKYNTTNWNVGKQICGKYLSMSELAITMLLVAHKVNEN